MRGPRDEPGLGLPVLPAEVPLHGPQHAVDDQRVLGASHDQDGHRDLREGERVDPAPGRGAVGATRCTRRVMTPRSSMVRASTGWSPCRWRPRPISGGTDRLL